MNKKTMSKLVLGLLAALSFNAIAQENPWMVRVRATNLNWDNGQTSTVQALDVNAKDKTIPEFDITYFFNKNVAAELVLTYPQKVDIRAGTLGNAKLSEVKALPPTLLLQYHFTDFGPLKPYVGAGVNYTRFSSYKNEPGVDTSIDKSSVGLAAQIGADYMLTKNWGINLDVKYINIKTEVYLAGAHVGNLDLSPIATSVGVTYKF
ncbi:OmpW/AlkL family protein [Polynucleobacter cosmopolitanus]|nr:OmpW family outer membrane protein [Polynucleobacter cosmopolitanus]